MHLITALPLLSSSFCVCAAWQVASQPAFRLKLLLYVALDVQSSKNAETLHACLMHPHLVQSDLWPLREDVSAQALAAETKAAKAKADKLLETRRIAKAEQAKMLGALHSRKLAPAGMSVAYQMSFAYACSSHIQGPAHCSHAQEQDMTEAHFHPLHRTSSAACRGLTIYACIMLLCTCSLQPLHRAHDEQTCSEMSSLTLGLNFA